VSGTARKGIVVPVVLALAGLAVLVGLGTWQVERKAWKEALIATLQQRLGGAPVALPSASEWGGMTPDNSEFMRVRLRADFAGAKDALVFTAGSAIRDDVKGPGYFVFSLARVPGGQGVVIDRGFTATRTYPAAQGPQEIVGTVRWPEKPLWFAAPHDQAGEVWTVRDQRLMAEQRGWGAVAPFYIEQEAPVPAGGVPHPARLKVELPNNHLQYAITWYGLAAVLAVMSVLSLLRRRRDAAV
jgi:cytochrome oxidase assembly protein ShyY1